MILQDQGSENDKQKLRRLQIAAMPIWQLKAMEAGVLRTCITCDYFNQATEGCALANDARPPAKVIALGCDKWLDDIPF